LLLSVVWGANDGVFTWQDSQADTQALDVTNGEVELHFTDDVANAGDLTETRLLASGTGFQITTTDIDLIRSDGNMGALDIGVDVGSEQADTVGTVDRIEAAGNVTKPINIYGNVGVIDVEQNLSSPLYVEGDVQAIVLRGGGTQDITIEGDLGSFDASGPGGPDYVGLLTARRVIGAFALSDGGFSYADDFATETLVVYNGQSNHLDASNAHLVAQDAVFNLSEDAATGTQVGQVLADDLNLDPLTFSIVGGNQSGIFAIDGATGRISVADNSQLDYESATVHTLTVHVDDAGGLSDTASVTVNVLDVNEASSVGNPGLSVFFIAPSQSPPFVSLQLFVPRLAAQSRPGPEFAIGPSPSANSGMVELASLSSSTITVDRRASADSGREWTATPPLSNAGGAPTARIESGLTSEWPDASRRQSVGSNGRSVAEIDRVFSDPRKLADELDRVRANRNPDAGAGPSEKNAAQPSQAEHVPDATGSATQTPLTVGAARFAIDGGLRNGEVTEDDEPTTVDAADMAEVLITAASTLTAGFVMYGAGSSLIVAGAASRLAHWKGLDPLAVLDYFEKHPVLSESVK
jgi:Cadherin domain